MRHDGPTGLNPNVLDDVIQEDDLRRGGARFFYCVDPYETIKFCFPGIGWEPVDKRELADAQVAGDYIHFDTQAAILIPTYREELDRYLAFVHDVIDKTFNRIETLRDRLGYDELRHSTSEGVFRFSDENADLLREIQQHFSQYVAVVLGLASLGLERFKGVYGKLADPSSIDSTVAAIAQRYRPSPIKNDIAQQLLEQITTESLSLRARLTRAAWKDASAIDWLLFMNRECESAYKRKALSTRCIFLYFSGADRTNTAFGVKAVRKGAPLINGRDMSFVRTDEHIFHRLVLEALQNKEEGSAHLHQLREAADRLRVPPRAAEDVCAHCVLSGAIREPRDCRWLRVCRILERLNTAAQERNSSAQNLALASRMERYFERVSSVSADADALHFIHALRTAVRDERLIDLTLARMKELYAVLGAQASTGVLIAQEIVSPSVLLPADVISVTLESFPARPCLRDKTYAAFASSIVEVHTKRYSRTAAEIAGDLQQLYRAFLEKDAELRVHSLEHEVVRCLLYLSYPSDDGAKHALQHAVRFATLFRADASEFLYIATWASRRAGQFSDAVRFASEGIRRYPSDPRHHHGRALAQYAAFLRGESLEGRSDLLSGVVADASRALALFEEQQDTEMQGVLCNRLCYSYSLATPSGPVDLDKARLYLGQLKGLISKDAWARHYPEFLHTEANLELQEYRRARSSQLDRMTRQFLRTKLESALRDIRTALEVTGMNRYEATETDIAEALDEAALRDSE